MNTASKTKRIMSFAMAMLIVFSLLPMQTFASGTASSGNDNTSAVADDGTTTTTSIIEGQVTLTYSANGKAALSAPTASRTSWSFTYNNGSSDTVTVEVTINNLTDQLLVFTYELNMGSDPVFGNESVDVQGSASVDPNTSKTFTFVTLTTGRGRLYLDNFDFTNIEESTGVKFDYNSALGSITVGDQQREPGYSQEEFGDGVTLTATPNNGVSFLGWVDADTGRVVSHSASVQNYKPTGEKNLKAAFSTQNTTAWFYASNKAYLFDDLEKAADYAASNNNIIVLAADGTLLAGNYTIPAGVTLLIPYDVNHTLHTSKLGTKSGYVTTDMVTPSAFRTLTMATGATLTVEGGLSVSALALAKTFPGHVCGPYGHIDMQDGSSIAVEENGVLYAWGFISGSGNVAIKDGGTVYENFQTMAWRGGNAFLDLRDDGKVYPLNQFYVQNVEVPMSFYPGATEIVYLPADSSSGTFDVEIEFVGGENGLFQVKSGTLVKDYNETTDYMDFTVTGTTQMHSLVISLMGETVNSSAFQFPIPNHFKIDVAFGGCLDILNSCSMLPGAELNIQEGATVNLAAGKSLVVYDLDEWSLKEEVTFNNLETFDVGHGFVFIGDGDRHIRPAYYTTSRGTSSPRGTGTANLKDAMIRVDGLLNASGAYLYTTSGGADICSNGTGVIKLATASSSFQEWQVLQGGYNNSQLIYVAIGNTPAQLKNADGSYVATANASTSILYYNNGSWATTAPTLEVVARVDWTDESTSSEFYSVQGALDAAASAGGTVVMLKDIALTETLEISDGFAVILDLNGHKLTNATGTVLTNYGTLHITDGSANGGGTLQSTQNVASAPSNMYGYAAVVRNHGALEMTNISVLSHTSGYRMGILNYPEGIIDNLDDITVNTGMANYSYPLYTYGSIVKIGSGTYTGYNAITADGAKAQIGTIGAQGDILYVHGANMGVYVKNGAKIQILGGNGSTIYIEKSQGGVNSTTGIMVFKGSSIANIAEPNSTVQIYAANAIRVENEKSKIVNLGNGGAINISASSHGIYILSTGSIDVIGNGGTISITSTDAGVRAATGVSIGTIAKNGTVVVVSQNAHAVQLEYEVSVAEIGKGLTAVALTENKYALRIYGDASDGSYTGASVALISGGYYYTPNQTRALAIDKYSSQTYPKGYSLLSTPVIITVGDVQYSALMVGHIHDYEVVFNWAQDYSSATANYSCSACGENGSKTCQIVSLNGRYGAYVTIDGQEYADQQYLLDGGMTFEKNEILNTDKALDTVPHTFEAWIKYPVGGDRGVILGSYNAVNSAKYISFEIHKNGNPRLCWHVGNASASVIFENVNVCTGEWLHLAITHDGTNVRCYVNGELLETKTAPTASIDKVLPLAANLALGNDYRTGTIYAFPGEIASVAVYTDVRTAEEIKKDMIAPDQDGLLIHYEVNDKTGAVIADLSGNGYNINHCEHTYVVTFNWAQDYSSATASYSCSACGENGNKTCQIVSLNGRYGAYVTIGGQNYTDQQYLLNNGMSFGKDEIRPTDKVLDAIPHTFEAWIKYPVEGGRGVILGSYNAVSGGKYINFEINTNGRPRLCWHDGTKPGSIIFEQDVRTGEWLHLTITHDGTNVHCYINGELVETQPAPADSSLHNALPLAANLALGNDHRTGTKYYFPGEIASVAVYTDVRTAEEIKLDMVAPDQDGLLIHYELNANSAREHIVDLSGNGYNVLHAHQYVVSFNWATDYSSVTATAVCTVCADSVEGHTVNVTGSVAVMQNRGYVATATIAGQEYTDRVFVMDGMSFTQDYIYTPGKLLATAPITFEVWVKVPTGTTKASTIIGSYSGSAGKFVDLELQTNGCPRLCWSDNASSSASTGSIKFTKGDVRTGEWVHIAIVYDASTNSATYYMNGVFVETLSASGTTSVTNTITHKKPMALGADFRKDNANWFPGKIASVAVYSDMRTPAEILSDMIVPGTDDLIIHYELTSVSASGTIKDLSNNGYDIENPWVEATEPDDYEFSFVVVGDTQKALENYPGQFHKIYDYILNNLDKWNAQFVFGLGDIVDYNILTEPGLTEQWEIAAAQIKRMNGLVPYSVIRGNHDEVGNFNKYFPMEEYRDVIGGSFNGDMCNTWQVFQVGDIKYLVLNLDFGPTADVIEWANTVIEDHPNYNVIITTHSYLQKDGTTLDGAENASPTRCYDEWYNSWGTQDRPEHYDGDDMWNALVSKHDNIVLLLCGHDASSEIVTVQTKGENGNIVTQMLINPQDLDRDMMGGAGMVATLYFAANGRDMTVRYYSTYHDKYFMAENQFATALDVHAWDDGVITKQASCSEAGEMTYTCTSCAKEHTKTVEIPATGHSYSEPVFTWNGYECTAKVTCTCGHEKNLDVEITSAVTTPATCVTKGVKTYTATTLWKDVTYTSSEHPTEELDIDSTNHIHTTSHEQQDATCTESGYTAGVFCEDCKQWISGHEEIQSNGHTPGVVEIENIIYGTTTTKTKYEKVIYCSECGEEVSREIVEVEKSVFAGMTMALNDNLEVKFVVTNSLVPEGAYMVIRRTYANGAADDVVTVTQDEWVAYTSTMNAAAYNNLAAREMIDMFYVVLYNAEGEIIDAYQDSIRDYAMRKLATSEAQNNSKGKTLFVDMLNYGAAAQVHFNYAKEDLANKYLTEAQQQYATPNEVGSNNMQGGAGFMGTTLSLESRIEMNFVFEKAVVTQNMKAVLTYKSIHGNTVTVTVEGKDFVQYTSTSWRITLGMPLVEGAQMVSCTVYDGDAVVTTAQDSMEGYLARKYTAAAIMPATWKFIKSAKAFFEK